MGLFNDRDKNETNKGVPVWFMRQAGRYHQHYQELKKRHDFMTLCKDPDLACEVTMGPIEDFQFDAAILFSDLLFPLEQLGMGLTYNPGPKLDFKLSDHETFKRLSQEVSSDFFLFQKQACEKLKKALPKDTTLLGFVGAPFTLYTYAVEGSHSGSLVDSKKGLYDGRYEKFCDRLLENVLQEMILQAEGGADALCIFDTAVGELCLKDFKTYAIPKIKFLTRQFKARYPNKKVIYYSRNTHINHLKLIEDDNIDVLGIDWRHNLAEAINIFSKDYYIQGNFDPCWLHLPWEKLELNLTDLFEQVSREVVDLDKWICGLGHGVLQQTPEENVRKAVALIHKNFRY